jgi:hypothetical protein
MREKRVSEVEEKELLLQKEMKVREKNRTVLPLDF